jgi:NRPS condensation-like uncharacterized protein
MNSSQLSPVDYIFTGAASQPITFAFFYSHRFDHKKLIESLNEALVYFPILKSKLKKISEYDYEYHISEDGLTIDIIDSEVNFEKNARIEDFITPVNSLTDEPLTKIKLTQAPNGSVLAVSISHALVDGFSYFHFLTSWARIYRGENFIKPHISRDIVSSYLNNGDDVITKEKVYSDCGLFYGAERGGVQTKKLITERIFIPDEIIKAGIDAANKKHNVTFSENDWITAMLWKKYVPHWNRSEDNPQTYVTCPFDFRRVLAGFPKNYFGCALSFASASIEFNELSETSIEDLALLIKESINKIKGDYIRNSLTTLENLRKQKGLSVMEQLHLRHPESGMIITNLTRMPLRDVNFGFGRPEKFIAYAEVSRSAAILPAEGGGEVFVCYKPE